MMTDKQQEQATEELAEALVSLVRGIRSGNGIYSHDAEIVRSYGLDWTFDDGVFRFSGPDWVLFVLNEAIRAVGQPEIVLGSAA